MKFVARSPTTTRRLAAWFQSRSRVPLGSSPAQILTPAPPQSPAAHWCFRKLSPPPRGHSLYPQAHDLSAREHRAARCASPAFTSPVATSRCQGRWPMRVARQPSIGGCVPMPVGRMHRRHGIRSASSVRSISRPPRSFAHSSIAREVPWIGAMGSGARRTAGLSSPLAVDSPMAAASASLKRISPMRRVCS